MNTSSMDIQADVDAAAPATNLDAILDAINDDLDDLVRAHGYFPATVVNVSHRVVTRIESINDQGRREVHVVYHNLQAHIPSKNPPANVPSQRRN